MKKFFAVCALTLLFTCSSASAFAIAHASLDSETLRDLRSASAVATGKVSKVTVVMQTYSIPPQVRARVSLLDEHGNTQVLFCGWRGEKVPITEGEYYLLWGNIVDGDAYYTHFKKLSGPVALPPKTDTEDFVFTVQQVIPPNVQKYLNPYGDGVFKFTITNVSTTPLKIDDAADFVRNLEVYIDGTPYQLAGVPVSSGESASPVLLQPGQIRVYSVNMLALKNVAWPQGASRIYFTFNYRGHKITSFFYYHSKIHDAARKVYEDANPPFPCTTSDS